MNAPDRNHVESLEAENRELREWLEAITNVSAGGPHISAEEAAKATWCALMRCREMARNALRNKETAR